MLVGHENILLPTTMVGNYPNPRWYDGYSYSRLLQRMTAQSKLRALADGAAIVRAELGRPS